VVVRARQPAGGHVQIEVIDHGLGIPHEQMGRLFQKFERVRTEQHSRIAGTGLGLYICRLIVEGHGGRIWAESEPGMGSTFSVLLPLDPRKTRTAG
jgi:signal transduction histidine kinase